MTSTKYTVAENINMFQAKLEHAGISVIRENGTSLGEYKFNKEFGCLVNTIPDDIWDEVVDRLIPIGLYSNIFILVLEE